MRCVEILVVHLESSDSAVSCPKNYAGPRMVRPNGKRLREGLRERPTIWNEVDARAATRTAARNPEVGKLGIEFGGDVRERCLVEKPANDCELF